jgi:mannose/cellobiose epimerase-like protein (N-acyl-D-glucosamine 2-epimerase family)
MSATNAMDFTFSDMVAGYVTGFDADSDTFGLRTSDGRDYEARLTASTFAEVTRNLGEDYIDAGGQMREMLTAGRFMFAYGVFYPADGGHTFDAIHLLFAGREVDEYRIEAPDWWIRQIEALGHFYRHAQFGDGQIDFRRYRTEISADGDHTANPRQEIDTISRLVYGFASAYMLTGNEEFLEAADAGTRYLREACRVVDPERGVTYWYHAIDANGEKLLASQFGDDWGAVPAYEQIYALAGPTQTYRITGDPSILQDIKGTIDLFNRYYHDPEQGGYFSHIDPQSFDPRDEKLGHNQARKNWNSVGDHAPAYLINLWLATGDEEYKKFLAYTFDTIVEHFPDYDESAFVQEKFHEDWSKDQSWGWQQNRAVVGHNLKIAWNLMRMYHLQPEDRYLDLARKIAEIMPAHGYDRQRTGWYDVVERVLPPGETFHRYAFHDRKAWWQQEQGILAYLILAGSLGGEEYRRLGRESAAFYGAWFLDHDVGGVYFNVLANGQPYMLGTERLKGSHSMSGYHSFELAYLSAVYTNLLITKQPMDFHFKPQPGGFPDGLLRVQPDILPPGSIRIDSVEIDGNPHTDFDAAGLTVKLPPADRPLTVKVRIVPA